MDSVALNSSSIPPFQAVGVIRVPEAIRLVAAERGGADGFFMGGIQFVRR
jgi:hypothetical protein